SHNTTIGTIRMGAQELGLVAGDPIYMASPVGHGTGTLWGVWLAWLLGSRVVLQDKWDPEAAVNLISHHRCAFTLSATPFALDVVNHLRTRGSNHPDVSSFRTFLCGGTTIPRQLVEDFKTYVGGNLLACYGQTEAFVSSVVRPSDSIETKSTCDGWPLP